MYCAGVSTGVIMTVLSVIFIIVPGVHVSHSSVYCVIAGTDVIMKVFYMMIIIEILIVLVLVLTIISKQDDIRRSNITSKFTFT